MLDNCGGDGGGGDKSKRKLVSRPTQRFWPEAIASIQPRLPSMQLTMTPSSPEHISPPPPDVAQSTVTASFSGMMMMMNVGHHTIPTPSPYICTHIDIYIYIYIYLCVFICAMCLYIML